MRLLFLSLAFFIFSTIMSETKVVASSKDVGRIFTNPMMWADVPDPDVIRVGKDFYLVSTTMHLMPGAPIMRSRNLVNWETVGYLFDRLDDTPRYNLSNAKEGTVYGRGQWATSLRYHEGTYYAYFSPNDTPYKGYLYKTKNPAGKWELHSRLPHFHDASLFFDDDDKAYVFYGTGELVQLNDALTGIQPGTQKMRLFERDSTETGLLEGSRVIKHEGRYYLLMISWPNGGKRRQVCYRSNRITGPYEKKIILEDNFDGFGYVGQGCIVDDSRGNWYGVIFQDRGGVGRVLTLMPCRWVEGWPMLGDEQGRVPKTMSVPGPATKESPLVISDDFSGKQLKKSWQWNHNCVNDAWSLKARRGWLRLKTVGVADNLYTASNTITQRMEGPLCSGIIAVDVTHMANGDRAGFAAFNGHSGILSIQADSGKKRLVMTESVVEFDDATKCIRDVKEVEKESIQLSVDRIYLRIDADFRLGQDLATFYYSYDNLHWTKIGSDFKMRFDYRKMFMGTKFAIFNYATLHLDGYIDVDFFEYKHHKQ